MCVEEHSGARVKAHMAGKQATPKAMAAAAAAHQDQSFLIGEYEPEHRQPAVRRARAACCARARDRGRARQGLYRRTLPATRPYGNESGA